MLHRYRLAEARPAAEFLAERLSDAARPVDVLALGSLTNIAEAVALDAGTAALRRLVIMGGAVHVAQVRPGMTPELLANLSAALHRQGIERVPLAIPFACPSNTGGR
jgi:inosine-uridine nucleoside N-ribohydrolase